MRVVGESVGRRTAAHCWSSSPPKRQIAVLSSNADDGGGGREENLRRQLEDVQRASPGQTQAEGLREREGSAGGGESA